MGGNRDYWQYSRKERAGIMVLLLLILATFFLPRLLAPRRLHPDSAWLKLLPADSPEKDHSGEAVGSAIPDTPASMPQKFYFNPNQLSEAGWRKLGVPAKTAATIQKYRQHGGRFRKAADLMRIYGLDPALARQLQPWVQLPIDTPPAAKPHSFPPAAKPYPKAAFPIDINEADSLQWLALPGIGPYLSSRILKFRNRLGGFFSVDQVAETYGLPDSTFQKIRPKLICTHGPFRLIGLNTASPDSLWKHPYITRQLAYRIVNYRNAHGRFRRPEELFQLLELDSAQIRRIMPYLQCEDAK